jgi:polyhydroxyalkanoate synthase subunit PhaC
MRATSNDSAPPRLPDAITHAWLARATRGIAPLSVVGSYMDWISHLAASPGKQHELLQSAMREWGSWLSYVKSISAGECESCVSTHVQDKRFSHEAWRKIPFNWLSQAFLINERWCNSAMTGVRGVSRHHEEVAAFTMRQWLDMWSPSNFVATNPEVLAHTISTGGANLLCGAINWWHDGVDFLAQHKPPGAEKFIPGKSVALTHGKVIYRNRLMELIQYDATTDTVFPQPLLIIPSWIMKYYILDLSVGNSLVKYLVDSGHTVFIMSWMNPHSEDRDLSLEDYAKIGIVAALKQINKVCPNQKIHALGYCLGGTLLSMVAAALAREKNNPLTSLTLLASQVDFEDPGELGLFIDESQIAYLEDTMWERGYLDGTQMAGAFALIKSNDLVWSRLIHEYLMGIRKPLTDLKAWNADATRMPYRMHSEYLRSLYLNNDLAEGRFIIDGKPVALKDLRTPMFVVSTELDHVSPWRSVYKIHLLTDCELTFVMCTGGHNVGVVNPPDVTGHRKYPASYQLGMRTRNTVYKNPDAWLAHSVKHDGSWWPAYQEWLERHSGEPVAPIPIGGRGRKRLTAIADAPGTYVHDA